MNDPMALDAEGICRCCLSDRRDTLRSIYDTNIRDMFVACTSLRVDLNDGLPGRICSMCVFKCISWSSFKQLCERSEEMLRIQYNIPVMVTEKPESTPSCVATDVSGGKEVVHEGDECGEKEQPEDNPMKSPVQEEVIETIVLYELPEETAPDQPFSENEIEDFTGFVVADKETGDTKPDNDIEEMITIADTTDYQEELTADEDDLLQEPVKPKPKRKSSKDVLPCPKCDQSFKSDDRLKAHLRSHLGQKPEVCPICHKGFDNMRALRRHRLNHVDGKMFTCAECGKSYKYQTSLTLHRKSHLNVKRFVCDLCGKSFIRAHGLRSHMLSHSSETPFGCDECDKRFKNEVMLRNHQLRHQGVKNFSCDECGKSFATSPELRIHSRVHSGDKPFVCTECDKAYKTKSHLTVHMRTHTGIRPYECDVCNRKFAIKKILNQHRLVHSGEQDYICDVCKRPFRRKSTLLLHLRSHNSQPDAASNQEDDVVELEHPKLKIEPDSE